MPTWDILVTTIEHRHAKLERLLDELVPQVRAAKGVGILVYRDNLEATVGDKRQRLVEASKADYVSFLDDDDSVPAYHVAKVLEALASEPDYVGWQERYTVDGVEQAPVYHSLRYSSWWNNDTGFYRGITHFNQIRRELALLVPFEGQLGEDRRWSHAMHLTGQVGREVYIDEVMHFHDETSSDGFLTPRVPLTEHPPLIKVPKVRYITGSPVPRPEPALAMERMWWRETGNLGVHVLAYRKGQMIPSHELPRLMTDTERANALGL